MEWCWRTASAKRYFDWARISEILIHYMVPATNRLNPEGFIFQKDNDPKHTRNVVGKYLQNKKIKIMNWPAQLPDLNPIEILWCLVNRLTQDEGEDELFESTRRR